MIDFEKLQLLIEAGGNVKEIAYFYIGMSMFNNIITMGFIGIVVWAVYKLIIKMNGDCQIVEKIARAHDGSRCMNDRDVESVCKILKERWNTE